MTLANRIMGWAKKRAPNLYVGGKDNTYMRRWYLIPRNRFFNIYVHHFLRSDDDRALHDHPWLFNFSWLLDGSYREHLPTGYVDVKEGTKKLRLSRAAHRIELYGDCINQPRAVWTLFITGPVVRNWGFYCPKGWKPWQDYLTVENGETKTTKGCV